MSQDIDILDPVPAPLTQDMSARTKAAIVVRFLMQKGAEIDLAALPTSLKADHPDAWPKPSARKSKSAEP